MALQEVYLIHHTHMDIGYTDPADAVLDQHLLHMDRVLDLCSGNENSPRDSWFHWTCESAWLVRDYLRCRPQSDRERLLHALRQGWIELQGFLTQPMTELPRAEELIANAGYAARLGRQEGFPVECAMINDIGGLAGFAPSILAGWGIRYLVIGVGAFRAHLGWADLPHLFYLRDKSGVKILIWNLGIDRSIRPQDMTSLTAVYGLGISHLVWPYEAKLMNVSHVADAVAEQILDYYGDPKACFDTFGQRLDRERYPYRQVMLQYAMDNHGPDPHLADVVQRINATGDIPHITLVTPRHFFRRMEDEYGDTIPVLDGILTDPWVDRPNAVPSGLKQFRAAQRTFHQARVLDAFCDQDDCCGDAQSTWDLLHLYADHTYGVDEWYWQQTFGPEGSCRDAAFDRFRQAWQRKAGYAASALVQARELYRSVLGRYSRSINSPHRSLLIWNPGIRTHSGPVEFSSKGFRQPLRALKDASGQNVPLQKLSEYRYLAWIHGVPPMGSTLLEPQFGTEPAIRTPDKPDPCILENQALRITVDKASGRIASIRSQADGTEFLDNAADHALGDVIYHRVSGVAETPVMAGMNQDLQFTSYAFECDDCSRGLHGPAAQSMVISGHITTPDGEIRIRREIVLWQQTSRIQVTIRLDKSETAEKESLYVAFPFAGQADTMTVTQNAGAYKPSADLLPGAMQDAFFGNTVQLANSCGRTTITFPDIPVFQLGGVRTGQWREELPFACSTSHVYGWLYNNLWNTDTPIWQDLLDTFRFDIAFDSASASLGDPEQPDLQAHWLEPNPDAVLPPHRSVLAIAPDTVHLLSVDSVDNNAIRLRLQETRGIDEVVHVTLPAGIAQAWQVDFFDQHQQSLAVTDRQSVTVDVKPYEIVSILLTCGAD